jgi:hypothetical protein
VPPPLGNTGIQSLDGLSTVTGAANDAPRHTDATRIALSRLNIDTFWSVIYVSVVSPKTCSGAG